MKFQYVKYLALGTYSSISPKIEAYVSKKLGLIPEEVSTQIIPRDRHAYFFQCYL